MFDGNFLEGRKRKKMMERKEKDDEKIKIAKLKT